MGFATFLHIDQINRVTLQTQICATEQTLILHVQVQCYCLFHYHGSTAELQWTLICYRPQRFIMNYTPNLSPPITLRKHRYQAKSFTLSKKHNIVCYHFQHSKLIKRRKKPCIRMTHLSENMN